jgi:glutathione peroxidase
MLSSFPYQIDLARPNGDPRPLDDYRRKVLLVVNTATQCGLTPQLDGLERLHKEFADRGLAILAFPSNQFLQNWGGSEKSNESCALRFGVTFDMFDKVRVNGPGTHPLFEHLKAAAPGSLGFGMIKWNFTKFLVSRDGTEVKRFSPHTTPKELEDEILRMLEQ